MSTTGNQIDPRGVNHPIHYNSHPSGVEIIEVNRYMTANVAAAFKYVMRRGEKVEPGKTAEESLLKDLDKAAWYLNDELEHSKGMVMTASWPNFAGDKLKLMAASEPVPVVQDFIKAIRLYMETGLPSRLAAAMLAVQDLKEAVK